MGEAVKIVREGGVGIVTMNRPEVLNALNPEMAQGLRESLASVEQDPSVRCVVVRGTGGHFMAGGDLAYFRSLLGEGQTENAARLTPIFDDVHGAIRSVRRMGKPVVASVQGAAAGFGLSLMAACDLAVVADNAVFTLAYCLIGTSPDGGSTFFLPRIVGLRRAMELALLGDRFDARQAREMGLVNRVVPAAELEAATAKLAVRLAAGPAGAYAATKALLNASLESGLDAQLDAEQASFAACAATADFAEGVNAFCEKRSAEFPSSSS
jgi:2-(1,2-epoxy-1,2-dihydrophenyl)acetyl-CoA isomerase